MSRAHEHKQVARHLLLTAVGVLCTTGAVHFVLTLATEGGCCCCHSSVPRLRDCVFCATDLAKVSAVYCKSSESFDMHVAIQLPHVLLIGERLPCRRFYIAKARVCAGRLVCR